MYCKIDIQGKFVENLQQKFDKNLIVKKTLELMRKNKSYLYNT